MSTKHYSQFEEELLQRAITAENALDKSKRKCAGLANQLTQADENFLRLFQQANERKIRAETAERQLLEYEKGEKKYSTKVGEGCDLTDAEQFELRRRLQTSVDILEATNKDLGVRLTGFNSWVSNLVGHDNKEERLPAIKKFVENLMGERDALKAQFTPNGALARENEKLRRDLSEMTEDRNSMKQLFEQRDRERKEILDEAVVLEDKLALMKASISLPVQDVLTERARQDNKWGVQNHDLITWSAILSEECGEFAQTALQERFGGNKAICAREEAVQCAAVALAIVECIDRKNSPESCNG